MSNLSNSSAAAKSHTPTTMTVADVWYALFRHKWKVILLALLGVLAAGAFYLLSPKKFVSEAKLLVRYVVETRSVEALGPDGQVRTPPSSTEGVVNSEREILMSLDLCRQVAEAIGPERIVGKAGEETNLEAAALTLYKGLVVEVPQWSSVIRVTLNHSDPAVAQQGLQRLIEFYFKRHLEIHRGLGTMDAVLAQQTDQVRSRLIQTDEELRNLRTKAGVLSLEDARRSYTEQISNIRQMILTAEAELAEYQSMATSAVPAMATSAASAPVAAGMVSPAASTRTIVPTDASVTATPVRTEESRKTVVARLESLRRQEQDLRELRSQAGSNLSEEARRTYTDQIGRVRQQILTAEADLAEYLPATATANNASARPAIGVVESVTNRAPTIAAIPSGSSAERYQEYRALLGRLESLHRQEMDLRNIYTDGNRSLIRVREQLAEAEAERKAIELENPTFAGGYTPATATSAATGGPLVLPAPGEPVDLNRIRALEARLGVLRTQLEKQRQEAAALEEFETSLTQLQRKRELDERNYRHFAAGLEQTRFDEALGSGKLANISVVQAPSPGIREAGKRMKISAMLLAGGLAGGIGLALLIELMLDHSVRRSTQLETSLALPLLSTIPRVRVGARKARLQIANGAAATLEKGGGSGPDIPGWSPGHPLRSHIEALRDRTLMHFEGDLRKPKLIGITACREGAGATTIACALAAALSESADGRVLLINLDAGSQSLHPLLLGQQARSVVDVVEAGDRETAMIGNNLYVASGYADANGNAVLHPTTIARMLPKIKMSDYDYVVFDMPIVSPTSITSKLAGMVDLVFMVAESEKDSQTRLKRACQLLTENNATFRIVLNKFERYVPKWLDQES